MGELWCRLFYLVSLSHAGQGNGDCSQFVMLCLQLCRSFLLTLFPDAMWHSSHGIQSFMNCSSIGPSHALQFFTSCSALGPFHLVQSFRNRLLQHVPHGWQLPPASPVICFYTGSSPCVAAPARSLLLCGLSTGWGASFRLCPPVLAWGPPWAVDICSDVVL